MNQVLPIVGDFDVTANYFLADVETWAIWACDLQAANPGGAW